MLLLNLAQSLQAFLALQGFLCILRRFLNRVFRPLAPKTRLLDLFDFVIEEARARGRFEAAHLRLDEGQPHDDLLKDHFRVHDLAVFHVFRGDGLPDIRKLFHHARNALFRDLASLFHLLVRVFELFHVRTKVRDLLAQLAVLAFELGYLLSSFVCHFNPTKTTISARQVSSRPPGSGFEHTPIRHSALAFVRASSRRKALRSQDRSTPPPQR